MGPNDGPVLAERGVGGTGMPLFNAAAPAAPAPASSPAAQNRGIGGTGAPSLGTGGKAAGNTGIVGAITGFASVCLNGVVVAYDPATTIDINGQAETPASLRVGQVAVIVAGPDKAEGDRLRANSVVIRYEVTGPVSGVAASSVTVAGQIVSWDANTRGVRQIQPGDWIAVSGFRNNAGVITATRIDPAEPGPVTVHGNIAKTSDGFWIGGLKLDLPRAAPHLRKGEAVTVTGTLNGAVLEVDQIAPDLLYSDPQAYFGPNVRRLLIQSYALTVGGAVQFATGTSISLLQGALPFQQGGLGIWSLVRLPGGTLQVIGHFLGELGAGMSPFIGGPSMGAPMGGGPSPGGGPPGP